MLERKNRVGRGYFAEVMKGGSKISTPVFLVRYRRQTTGQAFKCSVVVSKKIAKSAVDRNNFRRRVYAAINEIINTTPVCAGPYTAIFFVKSDLEKMSFNALKDVIKVILMSINSPEN